MASGVYAKVDIASASTWETLVAPTSAGEIKVCTVNICNRTSGSVQIRIALAGTTTVADADNIEYNVALPANGVLERTGILADNTNGIQVWASSTGVSAVAYGIDGNA
jgi:hypothetical protein